MSGSDPRLTEGCPIVPCSDPRLAEGCPIVPCSDPRLIEGCSIVSGSDPRLTEGCSIVHCSDHRLAECFPIVSCSDPRLTEGCSIVSCSDPRLTEGCPIVPGSDPRLTEGCTIVQCSDPRLAVLPHFARLCLWADRGLPHCAMCKISYCPACRTTLVATRFRVAVICPIIQVPHCIRVFFYFVWFVFINHIFQFYYELCTYCNILDIYLS